MAPPHSLAAYLSRWPLIVLQQKCPLEKINVGGGSVDTIINAIYISFSFQFLVNRIGAS